MMKRDSSGPVAKISVLPQQGARFDPWPGNQIPHATTERPCMLQLRPDAAK